MIRLEIRKINTCFEHLTDVHEYLNMSICIGANMTIEHLQNPEDCSGDHWKFCDVIMNCEIYMYRIKQTLRNKQYLFIIIVQWFRYHSASHVDEWWCIMVNKFYVYSDTFHKLSKVHCNTYIVEYDHICNLKRWQSIVFSYCSKNVMFHSRRLCQFFHLKAGCSINICWNSWKFETLWPLSFQRWMAIFLAMHLMSTVHTVYNRTPHRHQ